MSPGKNPTPVAQGENGQKRRSTRRETITKELSIFVYGKMTHWPDHKTFAYIYIVIFFIYVSVFENVSVIG